MIEVNPVCDKIEIIKIGEEFLEVWYDSDFQNSEATLLFMKTHVELMEKNWAPNSLAWCDLVKDSKIVYCKNSDNRVVGGIVFYYIKSRREGYILLSFTDPLWRRKGLNKILFSHTEKYMKSKGAKCIAVSVHKENMPRLIASQKNGLEIKYVRLIKDI